MSPFSSPIGLPAEFQPTTGLLQDRIILITGAGDGFGRAIATACAACGATIILLGRTLAKLERVYDCIVDVGHPEPALYPLNLEGATPQDYADLATTVGAEFRRLDGLVHNAAFLGSLTPIEHYEAELWNRVMQVNGNAPMGLTRACLPLLNASGGASVVFISDRLRDAAKPYWGAYAASKYAQLALMQTLAAEAALDGSVRVNAYDPGPMDTRMRRNAYPGIDPHTWARPEARAAGVLYLLSRAAQGVNGQLLA